MEGRRIDCTARHAEPCAADMQDALRCLEGRWKMMILSHLFAGPLMRFSELQRAIPKVSQKMLIQQLRDLERHGIVSRLVHPQVPPKVEYGLTDLGRALGPVFLALLDWADLRTATIGVAPVSGASEAPGPSPAVPQKVSRSRPATR
jgi:DNA-binding HxlR family transcriptional regulator